MSASREAARLLAEVVQEGGDQLLLLRLAGLELRRHLPRRQQRLYARAALVRRRRVSLHAQQPTLLSTLLDCEGSCLLSCCLKLHMKLVLQTAPMSWVWYAYAVMKQSWQTTERLMAQWHQTCADTCQLFCDPPAWSAPAYKLRFLVSQLCSEKAR